MKTRKKCYKSYKFWITTLLALSATSVFASLVLTSCTVNVTKNEDITSDVVISKEPNKNQEVSADSESGLTLSIDAKSTQGKDLKYQWYVDKTQLDNWNVISGATSSSYQIPSSELKSVTSESTWRYKAEIQYNDGSNAKLTSSVYTIKITPPTSTTPPENPSPEPIPPTEPDTPTTPDPNPENPITPPAPSPSPQPPTKPEPPNINPPVEPEKPPTQPEEKPEPKPEPPTNKPSVPEPDNSVSENISARNAIYNGLTKVQYDQEKWIGNNSVSISYVSKPNKTYLNKYLTDYLKNNATKKEESADTRTAYAVAEGFKKSLDDNTCKFARIAAGTGWILDYSEDENSKNLVNYYLASNMHVLDIAYQAVFKTKVTINNYDYTLDAKVKIPVSSDSVEEFSVYLSQPQYDLNNPTNNKKVPFGSNANYNTDWLKTSFKKEDINDGIIPLGSYNGQSFASDNFAYLMQANFTLIDGNYKDTATFYYKNSDAQGGRNFNKINQQTTDLSVIRLKETKNPFSNYNTTSQWATMFSKIQTMFNVDTKETDVNKNSSYIARLNALLTMLSSKTYDKSKVDDLFMFADYNKDFKNNTRLSIAGFPATDNNKYINFNSNTLSYTKADANITNKIKNSRKVISYDYKGGLYFAPYNWNNDLLLPNVNLMSGSSGSMSITQDYKITGIYWGVTSDGSKVQGIMTKIYSNSDESSMVKLWLKYVESKDSNSKLLKLFNGLKNNNYFHQ